MLTLGPPLDPNTNAVSYLNHDASVVPDDQELASRLVGIILGYQDKNEK